MKGVERNNEEIFPTPSQFKGSGNAKSRYPSHSVCKMRIDEESGKKKRQYVCHSVMFPEEWSSNELISFPLWWQKERDYVSERKKLWRESYDDPTLA